MGAHFGGGRNLGSTQKPLFPFYEASLSPFGLVGIHSQLCIFGLAYRKHVCVGFSRTYRWASLLCFFFRPVISLFHRIAWRNIQFITSEWLLNGLPVCLSNSKGLKMHRLSFSLISPEFCLPSKLNFEIKVSERSPTLGAKTLTHPFPMSSPSKTKCAMPRRISRGLSKAHSYLNLPTRSFLTTALKN